MTKSSKDIVVIPTACVDTTYFTPNLNVDEIIRKYGLQGKKLVLFVGRIIYSKGVHYLIKAFKLLKESNFVDVKLILIGPTEGFGKESLCSPYFEWLLTLIRAFNLEMDIVQAGTVPREELRKFYVASDIFVLPSIIEASPLVVSEAMASGKPIIASNVGSVSMQVKDGWNGFIIQPGNALQLAQKMEYLLSNPQEIKRMGKNSRKHSEKEFSWKTMTERLYKAYSI
jgi:glycosyltransferase involved in cell wall biosynthesis